MMKETGLFVLYAFIFIVSYYFSKLSLTDIDRKRVKKKDFIRLVISFYGVYVSLFLIGYINIIWLLLLLGCNAIWQMIVKDEELRGSFKNTLKINPVDAYYIFIMISLLGAYHMKYHNFIFPFLCFMVYISLGLVFYFQDLILFFTRKTKRKIELPFSHVAGTIIVFSLLFIFIFEYFNMVIGWEVLRNIFLSS